MAAMLKSLESRQNRLNYLYLPTVQRIVDEKLRGKKRKSLVRPWGSAGYRTVNANLLVKDEARLLAAAEANDLLRKQIVVERSLPKSALNEYFKKSGELLDGVEI